MPVKTCRKDPCDPVTVAAVEHHLRALCGPYMATTPRVHPGTGGLALRVQVGERHGWLSVEPGDRCLDYQAYDADGAKLQDPLPPSHYMCRRMAPQAQSLACHLLGQAAFERRRPLRRDWP